MTPVSAWPYPRMPTPTVIGIPHEALYLDMLPRTTPVTNEADMMVALAAVLPGRTAILVTIEATPFRTLRSLRTAGKRGTGCSNQVPHVLSKRIPFHFRTPAAACITAQSHNTLLKLKQVFYFVN